MAENKRNRKRAKRGRKRFFDATVYRIRFVSERTFAWIDKFRALLVRFDLKNAYFLAGRHLAFALINLRHLFARKSDTVPKWVGIPVVGTEATAP
jgi:transposase